MVQRRALLSISGLTVVTSLAGCVGDIIGASGDQDDSNGTDCSNPVIVSDINYNEDDWINSRDAEVDVLLQNTADRHAEVTITVRLVDRRSSPFNVVKTVGVPAGEVRSRTVKYGALSNERSPDTLTYSDTTINSRCIDDLDDISRSEDTRTQNREEEQRTQDIIQEAWENQEDDDDDDS